MSRRWRPAPLDLGLAAVAVAAVAYLLAVLPGYRWSGELSGGFLRQRPVRIDLAVVERPWLELGSRLEPGRFPGEPDAGGPLLVELVEPQADGSLRLGLALVAELDDAGQLHRGQQRLRAGERFAATSSQLRLEGVLLSVEQRDSP